MESLKWPQQPQSKIHKATRLTAWCLLIYCGAGTIWQSLWIISINRVFTDPFSWGNWRLLMCDISQWHESKWLQSQCKSLTGEITTTCSHPDAMNIFVVTLLQSFRGSIIMHSGVFWGFAVWWRERSLYHFSLPSCWFRARLFGKQCHCYPQ